MKGKLGFRLGAMEEFLKNTRRDLHQIPERSFCEKETARYILSVLADVNCKKQILEGGSIAAMFDYGQDKTAVFRCELDGLPVAEFTEAAYASQRDGFMHACGHDGHMAVCIALAKFLDSLSSDEKSKLKRNILILFQSGEESTGGARAVVDSKVLLSKNADRVFALHLWPGLPKGKVFSKAGVLLAMNAEVDVEVSCPQSHAADGGLDSLSAVAQLKMALEKEISLLGGKTRCCLLKFGWLYKSDGEVESKGSVSSEIKRIEKSLNSVLGKRANAKMSVGARNVVGGVYKAEGTLRAFDARLFAVAKQKIYAAVEDCRAKGYKVFCSIKDGGGAVKNSSTLLSEAQKATQICLLRKPYWQADDFSVYAESCPSLYMLLGTGNTFPLHSPYFDFDESILEKGLRAFVELAFS